MARLLSMFKSVDQMMTSSLFNIVLVVCLSVVRCVAENQRCSYLLPFFDGIIHNTL